VAKPIPITDGTFEAEVAKADLPVLVDFWAGWCGPCLMVAPIVDEIAQEYEGKLKVTKLDVDASPATATRFGIQGIPTLLLFKNGQEVERLVGYMPKDRLVAHIKSHLS
jgi:thioredoxin